MSHTGHVNNMLVLIITLIYSATEMRFQNTIVLTGASSPKYYFFSSLDYVRSVAKHRLTLLLKSLNKNQVALVRLEVHSAVITCCIPLQWRHNGHDGVSNHQPHDYLLNRLFGRRAKKHQSSAALAFVRGIHRWPVNSPHKWPVTRKMFPFDVQLAPGGKQ